MKRTTDADNLHRRLRKIAGQVKAIDRMVDEDVPCEDLIAQINAATSALHRCGQVALESQIRRSVHAGAETGDADAAMAGVSKAVDRFANM